jgi:hypothetical protein
VTFSFDLPVFEFDRCCGRVVTRHGHVLVDFFDNTVQLWNGPSYTFGIAD